MNDSEARVTADELARWRTYVGRSEIRRQWLDAESLRRFAAAVGSELDVERFPPPLAHWAYFLETVDSRRLGIDGHPQRGDGILPPVRLPRRMFAASSMTLYAPLTLYREAELTLTVSDVKHRTGKSGDLILIDVDRTVMQEGTHRTRERQTLVYRGAQEPVAAVQYVGREAEPDQTIWMPSSVELFRFSAVTFNSHRIHYDLPYAQTQEGYPALVVQAPLTAAKLFSFAKTLYGEGDSPHTFQFRAVAPLFAGQPVQLEATGDGRVDAIRCDGAVAMSAQWAPLRGSAPPNPSGGC